MVILGSLAPDLAIIALGYLLGAMLSSLAWQQIDKLSYFVLYPALLFAAASNRVVSFHELLLFGSLGCAIVTAGFLLALLARRTLTANNSGEQAGILQNAWRFNTALGFVAGGALTQQSQEVTAVLAVVVGLGIPLANVFAIFVLTRGQSLAATAVVREVVFNPFLLASVAGITVAMSGVSLPETATSVIDRLAQAALPMVLLSLGAALQSIAYWPPERLAIVLHGIKLIALPSLVWFISSAMGFTGVVPATLLIFAALPTASAAHVLAARYGADPQRVAMVVMQSTAISLLTLPGWTTLAASLIR